MSRILKAYRTRFYQLLRLAGARRVDQGADWLVARAKQLSARGAIPLTAALMLTFDRLESKPGLRRRKIVRPRGSADIHFYCDAGLGGLARWLRGAGYQALWKPDIADDALLKEARERSATILTTDSMLMERKLLRDQIIASYWLPPTLSIAEQLERVFCEFKLRVSPPRCMSCGGELVRGDKESLRDQIPPRTYRWLDEYFVCTGCGKLFWHGTHWGRIVAKLEALKEQ